MDDLKQLRNKISDIDQQLFDLLYQRFVLSKKVKVAKQKEQKAIYDPKREEAILKSIPNTTYKGQIEILYQTLFSLSKEIQNKD